MEEDFSTEIPVQSQKSVIILYGMVCGYTDQIRRLHDYVEVCYRNAVNYYPHDELHIHDEILKCCVALDEIEYLTRKVRELTLKIHELD